MSQYIPGIVQYVPQVQPYRPDLNFYQKVLETKQAQYKAGYDQLSSLYGTLLEAPMSRADNIDLRNKFFNQIGTQIAQISAMDLSLPQNVEAASKVFQPLIDNDYILKDMSFTKTAYKELQRGEALRNCIDPKKCQGQYWEGGARLIHYNIEDFKAAKREKTLNMQNPRFVPKVNISKQAMDYAKEMGFKITLPSYSPDGRYLVHTTNGPNMIPGLADTFMSVFGDDPAAADYYNAVSELNRNDFIYSEENISKYGSKDAAENFYLDTMHRDIVNSTSQQLAAAREQEKLASSKKATIDGIITSKGVDPNNPSDQDLVKSRYQTMVDHMISKSNAENHENDLNSVTDDGFDELDLESKRFRIDRIAGKSLMQNALYKAANDYAMQTMDVKMEVDQYALKQFDHGLSMARMHAQHEYDKALDDYKLVNEKKKLKYQATLDVLKDLYPNSKKNGATPDGANPNNPGWRGIPFALPGASAVNADLKGSDTKQLITATDDARSSATDLVGKAYYELKSIIDTPDGAFTSGGVKMTPEIRTYYEGKLKELYGVGSTKTVKETAPEGESFLGLIWNTITGAFTDTEKTVTTGGYLDENGNLMYTVDGKLGTSFSSNPDFDKPESPYSWEQTAKRVTDFFKNDPIGKRATSISIDPATGQPSSGVLKSIADYNLASQNYNNYLTAQKNNNSVVHNQLMSSAARDKVISETGLYPTAPRNPDAGWLGAIFAISTPDAIKQYTRQSLDKMVKPSGVLMTYPEFENAYANSDEARKVAEKVVQETYKTQPGENPDLLLRNYDNAVEIVLENMRDDAEDIYEQYMDQFTSIYNQDKNAVVKNADLKGFTPLSNFYRFNDAGAGVQADRLVSTVDPAYPGDVQAQDYREFYEKIVLPNKDGSNSGIQVFKGLGGDLSERRFWSDDADPVDNAAGAFTALQALNTELNETRDAEDKTRGIFDMYMHPIILNDPNKVAFSFSVSPQYTDTHTGSTKAMKFMNGTDREFTIVIDKDKVPEVEKLESMKRLNQGPYTIAMRANKKIELNEYPLGGFLNILPTENDSYVAMGQVNYPDIDGETFKTGSTNYVSYMGPGESLENFTQNHQQMLATLHLNILNAQEQIKAMSPSLIKNPNVFDNQ